MTDINDGGPAFPVPELFVCEGMSLRDYLAGQAINGLCSENSPLQVREGEPETDARARFWRGIADLAYLIADATLLAREVKPDGR